jgi:[protein-PII] uridylyltransferase
MKFAQAYHDELDETLRSVSIGISGIAMVALGSYARREMAMHSDADILLLVPESDSPDVHGDTIRRIHERIADAHVVCRTVEECAAIRAVDYRSWLALLESRCVCGDGSLYASLRSMLWDAMRVLTFRGVMEQFRAYANSRRHQYGDAVKLLEPNIKNSIGSLRDIHALYHYGLIRWMESGRNVLSEEIPAFDVLIRHLPLPEERKVELENAWIFFQRVRNAMHAIIGHLHDTLEYELQRTVAENLGYGDRDDKESVEMFMREYYACAGQVRYAFTLLFLSKEFDSEDEEYTAREGMFLIKGKVLHMPDGMGIEADSAMMSLFDISQRHGVELGSDVVRAVDEYRRDRSQETSAEAYAVFDGILRKGKGVAKTLRRMNELGVLGALMPEWRELVHFFQHNIYHYYTVDEHCLIAIDRCEKQLKSDTIISDILRTLDDPSILYYAILFHDIAKPVDLPKHEIAGAEIAERILKRMGRTDIVEDVRFLVRYHLLMEQVAFRRNYHDATTLQAFTEQVGTEQRLNLLFLLTYADMSALNPNVWTDWKQVILLELRALSESMLRQSHSPSRATVRSGTKTEKAQSRASNEGNDEIDSALTPEEIAAVGQIDDVTDVVVLFSENTSYTDATVLGKDAPFFLARLSAVFMSCDASIIHARIDTWKEGIVVDRFRLVNIADARPLSPDQIHSISILVQQVWTGVVNTETLFDRHRRKWKRRIRKDINPSTRIDVEYHSHTSGAGQRQTIIDVFAPDTFGLLYKLTERISSFGLDIAFATIATRVDGVVDSFYVTTLDGAPFDDPHQRTTVRDALMACIHSISIKPTD